MIGPQALNVPGEGMKSEPEEQRTSSRAAEGPWGAASLGLSGEQQPDSHSPAPAAFNTENWDTRLFLEGQ